jgi:hypothetical protein
MEGGSIIALILSVLCISAIGVLGVFLFILHNREKQMLIEEETTSRINDENLVKSDKDMTARMNSMDAAANSFIAKTKTSITGIDDFAHSVGSELGAMKVTDEKANAQISSMQNDMSKFFIQNSDLTNYVSATELHVGSSNNGIISTTDLNGMSLSNSNALSKYDLTTNRANVGTNLNLAGTLNFAGNSSSYMLGVDGTSMFLKLSDANDNFIIKDSASNNIFDVGSKGTTVLGNVAITGKNVATEDVVSNTNLCVGAVCLNQNDISKLQTLARA